MASTIPQATQDKILGTLRNQLGAAEGSLLPPPQQNSANRVPIVSNLSVFQTQSFVGGTQFTLLFNQPTSNQIDHYSVYVAGVGGNQSNLQGPSSVTASPAIIRVSTLSADKVTFYVQTVLKSGLMSSLANSPTCTGTTIAGTINGGDIPAGTISLAQMATQTEGSLITYNASSVATLLTPGTAGYVLSTQGAGALPQYISVPSNQAAIDKTAQTANISSSNVIASLPVTGLYRLTVHIAVTTAATSSSTLPSVSIGYTEGDSSASLSGSLTNISTGNTTATVVTGEALIYAKAATAVTYSTANYASSGATAMQYALHIRLELIS